MQYSKKEYDLLGFQVSSNPNKKYDAFIKNKKNGNIVKISFGSRFPLLEQYKDQTGIGAYSYLDHLDEKRRISFRKRFNHSFDKNYFSPTYFSYLYLW